MPHLSTLCFIVVGWMLAVSPGVLAAAGIESRPVHFAKGASSTTIKGSLKGDRTIDYKLSAKAGQTMAVALKTSNGANYFNVLPPGSKDVAIFVGSTGGNDWSGELPADGTYTVRVYLMRSAGRRNESANYTLTVGVTGNPVATAGVLGAAPTSDAKVKGTPYHATGQVPCSMGGNPDGSTQCEFGVVRGSPGNAEVHLKPAGGLERVLTFKGARVTSGNEKVKASMSGGMWTIEVNDFERYRIPESVVAGG